LDSDKFQLLQCKGNHWSKSVRIQIQAVLNLIEKGLKAVLLAINFASKLQNLLKLQMME